MRHQVQRKIEWRNGQHRTHGKALHKAPTAFVAFGQVQGNALAAQARGLLGSGLEGEHGTIDLRPRKTNGLARLGNDELGEALLLLD